MSGYPTITGPATKSDSRGPSNCQSLRPSTKSPSRSPHHPRLLATPIRLLNPLLVDPLSTVPDSVLLGSISLSFSSPTGSIPSILRRHRVSQLAEIRGSCSIRDSQIPVPIFRIPDSCPSIQGTRSPSPYIACAASIDPFPPLCSPYRTGLVSMKEPRACRPIPILL